MNLGFGTGYFWRTDLTNEAKVEQLINISNDAIELGLGYQLHMQKPFSDHSFELIKQFRYRSIHAVSDIRYPSTEAEALVPQILEYARKIDAHTLTLHPDRVDDFSWVTRQFGSLLAYENMDWRKDFGRTVKDMHTVFAKSPDARWVCDVNHIYTWDKTMKAADAFYDAFKDRLAHYHLSGFGGTSHQCLAQTHEDIIFSGIKDDRPIILESVPDTTWINPREEFEYVKTHLSKTPSIK